jgi:two-component system nitrate/nitrite response regulator NarL
MRGRTVRVVLVVGGGLLRDGIRALLLAEADIDIVRVCDDGVTAARACVEQDADVLVVEAGLLDGRLRQQVAGIRIRHPGFRVVSLHEGAQALSGAPAGGAGWDVHVSTAASFAVLVAAVRGALRSDGSPPRLTAREVEVVVLLARALTNRQIAHRLGIAPGTVKRHVSNVMAKLGAVSRLDVVNRTR